MDDDKNHWAVELGRGLGNLQLGLERSEVLRRLQEAEIEFEAEEDEPEIYGGNADFILTLSETTPGRLIQIAVEDDRVHFGSQPVLGRRLHEITRLLQVQPEETIWRSDEDPEESLPTAPPKEISPTSDEELLESGTLWVRPLGLGLRLRDGQISEVVLRHPEHSPAIGVGPLTPQQLDLSRRDDLVTHLKGTGHAARPRGCFRPLSTIACFALLGCVVWEAAKYQKRWHDAPSVMAEVVEVRPNDPEQIPTEFLVAYRDNEGVERRVTLSLADVYVPQAIGDQIELKYLPDAPHQPLGPGRVRDAAFVKYFPVGIAIFGCYLVLQVVASIVGMLFRQTRRTAT